MSADMVVETKEKKYISPKTRQCYGHILGLFISSWIPYAPSPMTSSTWYWVPLNKPWAFETWLKKEKTWTNVEWLPQTLVVESWRCYCCGSGCRNVHGVTWQVIFGKCREGLVSFFFKSVINDWLMINVSTTWPPLQATAVTTTPTPMVAMMTTLAKVCFFFLFFYLFHLQRYT